jgi:hypothetical protein
MGYRSDVLLAIAVRPEDADTFWAAYIIYPGVQEAGVAEHWKRVERDGAVVFYSHHHDVKWYESYPDVKAFEVAMTLGGVLRSGGDEFPTATCFIRVGEDDMDVERCFEESACAPGELREVLGDMFQLRSSIEVDV